MTKKQFIISAVFFLLVAAVLAVAIFWRSSLKEIPAKKEQPASSKEIQPASSPAPASGQTDQAVQADQISAIDKSAQKNLGGDYKIEGASFVAEPKEKNGVKVNVGDKSARVVLPELTLSRWDETEMKIRPKALDGIAAKDQLVSFEKDKIKFDTPKVAYSLENLPVSEERPEGGFEYNIVLKEKPATNVVSLGMETENLDFFYQPALKNLNPDGSTWEDNGSGGRSTRPADANGSYAVYYKDGKSGDYTALGGKNYMAGKAFHIYRPRIDDSAGNWTWGDLHIDEKAGLLTVTIPQDFLDKAVYPVRHAAGLNFGFESIGVSEVGQIATSQLFAAKAPTTPAVSGVLIAITGYVKNIYTFTHAQFIVALYTDDGGSPSKASTLLAGITSGFELLADYGWRTSNINYDGLIASTQYWLGFAPTASKLWIMYDTVTSMGNYRANVAPWPDPFDGSLGAFPDNKYSIYATYTPAATGTPINIKSNVNFGNNVNLK